MFTCSDWLAAFHTQENGLQRNEKILSNYLGQSTFTGLSHALLYLAEKKLRIPDPHCTTSAVQEYTQSSHLYTYVYIHVYPDMEENDCGLPINT